MSDKDRLARGVETLMLGADMRFFIELARNPYLSSVQGSAIMCFYPFLAAFVRDSSLYVQKWYPGVDRVFEAHEDLIVRARLSIKPLEVDNRVSGRLKTLEEVAQEIDDLIELSDHSWIGDYPYVLRVIRKLRQPTVGASFVGDELISTTHTGLLNLGFSKESMERLSLDPTDMGGFVFEVGRSIGGYIAALAAALDIILDLDAEYAGSTPPTVRYTDYFSWKLYPRLAKTVSHRRAVCVLLMAVVAQVNFARLLLPHLSTENKLAIFKAQFLALYEVIRTLDKLMQYHSQQRAMTDFAAEQVKQAKASSELRTLKKCKALRNALIHYEVEDKWTGRLSPDLPLNGLVEAHARGASLDEVGRSVLVGLDHVARHLGVLFSDELAPRHTFD